MNLYQKLEKELKIPPQLTEKGKVFIQLSLDTAGNISEKAVNKGLSKVANEEALIAFSAIDIQFYPS